MSPNVLEAVQEAQAEWQLHDYVRFLRQHWTWLLFCGALGWGMAWIYASRIPDLFEARTRILIDRYTAEAVRFSEIVSPPSMRDLEFLATEQQLITSSPVLEAVVAELKLTAIPPFSNAPDPTAVLNGMIRVAPVRQTKLVDIMVTTTNPGLAMQIANTLAQAYAQLNLERRRQQTTGGAQWLREEVGRTEAQMKAAQEALQRFKEEHQMVSLEDRQNVIVQRLTELSSAATEAKTARLKAEAEQVEVDRALANSTLDTLPEVQQSDVIKALKGQIASKEGELADRRKVYGERHPTILQTQAELEALHQQLRGEARKVVEAIRSGYAAAQAREQELQQALAEQERLALELNRLSLEYNNLSHAAQAALDLYSTLAKRLKELEVAESLQANNIRIIDDAKIPQRPVAPNRRRIGLIGIFLGVAFGGLFAYLRVVLSRTVETRQELEAILHAPFLGYILHIPLMRLHAPHETLFFLRDPDGQAAEGVRAIRTTLEFLLPDAPVHRLIITSSVPEDGKSLVSANLAVSLQELGRRVVLIDADMRRPALFRTFRAPLEPGLSAYLQGQATLTEILQTPPTAQGVTVIAAGAVPPRPADLLASPRMAQLLAELSTQFQYLILDTPPVLAVTDAVLLARLVEGVVLVARAKKTARDALVAAYQQLAQAQPKFQATLLNDVRPERDRGYHYRYDYYRDAEHRRVTPSPRLPATGGKPSDPGSMPSLGNTA